MRVLLVIALCIVSAAAFTKRCRSSDECDTGECCVNYVLVSTFGGHCQKTRKEGQSCTPLSKVNEENPKMFHFQCPCEEGLNCVAKHEIKIGDHIVRHRPECVVPEDGGNEDGGNEGGGNEDGSNEDGSNEDGSNEEIGEPEAE